jgi:hypothetical protein
MRQAIRLPEARPRNTPEKTEENEEFRMVEPSLRELFELLKKNPGWVTETIEETQEKRPRSKRIPERRGKIELKPFEIPESRLLPDFEKDFEAAPDMDELRTTRTKTRLNTAGLVFGALIIGTLFLGVIWYRTSQAETGSALRIVEEDTLPNRKKNILEVSVPRAREFAEKFLSSSSADEIAALVIDGENKRQTISDYLSERESLIGDPEEISLTALPLSLEDLERGMVAFHYVSTGSDILSSFPPILSNRSLVNPQESSLLEQAAVVETSQAFSEPAALVLAKRKGNEFKIDWDVFLQTKDRQLAAFRDGELGDAVRRFRVVVSLDYALPENGESVANRILRLQDPLHSGDVIRVEESPYADHVRRIVREDQRREMDGLGPTPPRNATVDLEWDKVTDTFRIHRFVCWEFENVGGMPGEPIGPPKQK